MVFVAGVIEVTCLFLVVLTSTQAKTMIDFEEYAEQGLELIDLLQRTVTRARSLDPVELGHGFSKKSISTKRVGLPAEWLQSGFDSNTTPAATTEAIEDEQSLVFLL